MSDSEWTEGLKKKVFSLVIVNPSDTACAVPAPRKGEPFGTHPYQPQFTPIIDKINRVYYTQLIECLWHRSIETVS